MKVMTLIPVVSGFLKKNVYLRLPASSLLRECSCGGGAALRGCAGPLQSGGVLAAELGSGPAGFRRKRRPGSRAHAQDLGPTGLAALQPVGSSQTSQIKLMSLELAS